MAQHWYYVDPDAGVVEFTDHVNLNTNPSVTTNAEQGAVGSSSMTVDDPLGELDLVGHRKVYFEEDAATFARVFTGYSASRDIHRDTYRTGAARKWELELVDINSLLWRKVMAGNDTDRPAETDVARMQWLLSTGEAGFFADVTTYVSTLNPVDMDANPDTGYNGQMFQAVIDDCAQQSGKNYYALDVFDSPNYVNGVWYGHDAVATFSTATRISNLIDDVDSVITFYPSIETTLRRDPSRIFSGVFGNFDGGYTYQSDSDIIAAFANRDTVANWPNIKTLAKAQARAFRYLADLGTTEEDVITTAILVTPEHVNDVRAGHRMSARFSHLLGYEDWTDFRVIRRTVTITAPGIYEIGLDLTPIGPTPVPASCTTAIITGNNYTSGTVNIGCHDWSDGPISGAVSLTPGSPSLIVAIIGAIECSFNPGPFVSVDSPYTFFGDGARNGSAAGYQANTTSGGTFGANFTGGDVKYQALLAASIPTTAAAPVQTANDISGPAVLSSPPTPGNIIIVVTYALRNAVVPRAGWTTLASDVSLVVTDGLHGMGLYIGARCVQEGDGTTVLTPNSSFAHASFVSEWAIT